MSEIIDFEGRRGEREKATLRHNSDGWTVCNARSHLRNQAELILHSLSEETITPQRAEYLIHLSEMTRMLAQKLLEAAIREEREGAA